MNVNELFQPQILALLVGALAIIGGTVVAITESIVNHRKRMAKIEHGIDLDAKDGPK